MSEWIECPLEKLADISSGGTPSRANPSFWNGYIPWVTPTDITACQTNYLFDTRDTVTEIGVAASSAKLLPEGTLLLTSRATIGELKIAARPLTTNQGFKNLVPRPLVDGNFLFYQLSLNKAKFERYAAGSTFLEINRRDVGRVAISLPRSVEVQQKIARILGTIDQAIEKTQVLIDKYQQIKAGLMHDLFTRGIGSDGQLRPCREQSPELYQQTPIGWLPKEWVPGPLKRMAQAGVPHIKTGPFGSTLKGEHWQEDGVPVITIGALGEGEFAPDELLFVSESYARLLTDYRMKQGEVVFSRVADVGRSVVIEWDQNGWVMSSNLMRIHLDQNKVNPHFLQHLLSFDSRVRKQIRCKVNSSGRDVANSEILNSISFPWPPIDEQNEIVSRAFSVGSRLSKERDFMRALLAEKSGLMHDLLTGEVPVPVESEEERAVETV